MIPRPPDPSRRPKVALITGAAKRVGRACALELADMGFDLVLHHRASEAEIETTARDAHAKGVRVAVLKADLSREADVQDLAVQTSQAFGPVGVLVNNASVFDLDLWDTVTRETWDAHMETNLRAPFVLSQALARNLPDEAIGVIVNLIDERVWNLTPYFTSYTLSKAGLWTLTQTLALALAPRIRVNAIGPGPALPSPRQTDAEFARQAEAVPLGHPTSPEEIARAVRFILDSPSLTGQMLALDGGQHMNWSHPTGAPAFME